MKYYIWGKPNKAPDILNEYADRLAGYYDNQGYERVHEFEAGTVVEANGYFKGYVTRWKEIHCSTSLFKHYIWARPGFPPDQMSDTPEQEDERYVLVHHFEVQHWEFAAVYFMAYVARWAEAPDVFGDVHAFHQVTDLPHPADLTLTPGADQLVLRERLITEEVNDELLPALIQLRHLQVDGYKETPGEERDPLVDVDDAKDAVRRELMVDIADGIVDAIYVLAGCGVTMGIPLGEVWHEVQRSNMAKVDPETGKVRRRDDGKILKPEGWTPPDVKKALGFDP